MADIEFSFEDNRVQIKRLITDAIGAALLESSGEIVSQTARNTPVDSGQLKGSWKANVDETNYEAIIGSQLENAIWNEFGTGEYALNKDGRKGYWVYVKGSTGSSNRSGKTYNFYEAKRITAYLREQGLDAYYTKGKKPQRSLHKGFEAAKRSIVAHFKNEFGARF